MRRSSCPVELEHGENIRRERPTSSQRLCRHAKADSLAAAKAATSEGWKIWKHPIATGAKSAPSTPRLTQSHSARKNAKQKQDNGGKAAVPRTRRGRRASSPAVQVDVPEEMCGQDVPVRTLWIFDESQEEDKAEPEELPLSCQARRRSGVALEAVTWRAAAPLPVVSSRLAAANVPGRSAVMAMGGADALGFSLDAVHIFENSKWLQLPPLPAARQALAGASVTGGVCALGGRTSTICGSTSVAADFFDFGAERWVELPPLMVPRAFHAAAAFEGKIYVLGGMDADGRRLASVDCLDPREGAQMWDCLALGC